MELCLDVLNLANLIHKYTTLLQGNPPLTMFMCWKRSQLKKKIVSRNYVFCGSNSRLCTRTTNANNYLYYRYVILNAVELSDLKHGPH